MKSEFITDERDPFALFAGFLFLSTLAIYFLINTNDWVYPIESIHKTNWLFASGSVKNALLSAFPIWNLAHFADSLIKFPVILIINFIFAITLIGIINSELKSFKISYIFLFCAGIFFIRLPHLVISGSPVILSVLLLTSLNKAWEQSSLVFLPLAFFSVLWSPLFLLILPFAIFDDNHSHFHRFLLFTVMVFPIFILSQYLILTLSSPFPAILRSFLRPEPSSGIYSLLLIFLGIALLLFRETSSRKAQFLGIFALCGAVIHPFSTSILAIATISSLPFLLKMFIETRGNLVLYSSLLMIVFTFVSGVNILSLKKSSQYLSGCRKAALVLQKQTTTPCFKNSEVLKWFYNKKTNINAPCAFLIAGTPAKPESNWIRTADFVIEGKVFRIYSRDPEKAHSLAGALQGFFDIKGIKIKIEYSPALPDELSAPRKDILTPDIPVYEQNMVCKEINSGYFSGLNMGAVLDILSYERLSRIWLAQTGGRTVKFRFNVNAPKNTGVDFLGVFKPAHRKMDFANWKGEIAAFRLAKLLGINNIPPATVRQVSTSTLRNIVSNHQDQKLQEIFKKHVLTEESWINGAAIVWISDATNWEPDENIMSLLSSPSASESTDLKLLRQLSDMILIDFLTNNYDRFSGGNLLRDGGDNLYFIDNGAAFTPEQEWKRNWRFYLLKKITVLNTKTWSNLIKLKKSDINNCLGALLNRRQFEGLIMRINELAAYGSSLKLRWGDRMFFPEKD
ncbi:hypothetical protein KKF34_16460 [Myxococcota bacterium]|nr:hypothetical protein [Myxococcota bacterium]MBU1381961.1 hypothetical protein [Myxococcota bacterium]MBU1498471.1 hypothetical protein [Myxococcota bacterium]